ncbi:MAG: ABC transporter permease [Thermoleophilia bacterium]
MAQLETEYELEHGGHSAMESDLVEEASRWQHFKELVRTSWMLKIGLLLVFAAIFLTIFGPMIAPHPLEDATPDVLQAPSGEHWFGTDGSGFDVFSRVIAAPRIDVLIALAATALSLVLGSLIGLIVSFFKGWMGELTMRFVDVVQAFPLFVLAIIFVVGRGRSTFNIIVVIALLNIPIYLRLIRAEVFSLRERVFVESARAGGDSGLSIALRHVMPNAMSPGFAQMSITMGYSIIVAAGLSFIGAGIQPPKAEWGAMIAAGANGIQIGQWWPSLFPGIAMSLTVFGFAVVGEALQAVFLRQRV